MNVPPIKPLSIPLPKQPDDGIARLLRCMQSVLYFGGQWHARAQQHHSFSSASTPEEAMQLALKVK